MIGWIFLLFQLLFALFFFFLALSFYTGAPFVPSHKKAIGAMMRLAHIQQQTIVYDLGSGSGVLLFEAAKRGAKAIGYEINPFLVLYTNVVALIIGQRTKVKAIWNDFWKADISKADVIFLYLIPWKMKQLEHKLITETKPGTIIISNSFIFPTIPCITTDLDNHIFVFKVPKQQSSAKKML